MATARGLAAWMAVACAVACSARSTRDGEPADAGLPTDDPASRLPREPAQDGRFDKITLHREFYCEGASFGDFNGDGATDVVAGPDWYEGPGFGKRHAIWPRVAFDPHGYSDCFFEYPYDFDADGLLDVLVVGFPGVPAAWYENPGSSAVDWVRHDVIGGPVDGESPAFADVTGDGVPELVHMQTGQLGWSAPLHGANEPWVFSRVGDSVGYGAFTHGLGVGDLDGDGDADVLEATGYYLQQLAQSGVPPFVREQAAFGAGGAQMPVLDVDGDGDGDIVTTLAAHGYGLAWFEQLPPDPHLAFAEHVIVPETAPTAASAVVMHEPHALAVGDIDGDGVADLVTGERFWGHVPAGMPDFDEPARLYWFRAERTGTGVNFVPTLIDDDSGVGTQLTLGDLDGDARVDVVVANKKGAFVFLQR